jgi:hypothetical protein
MRLGEWRYSSAASWCFPWVELQSSVGALAECLLERRSGCEPEHLGCLGGELAVGVGCQVQLAGDTTTGELVIPGDGELAGARLGSLVAPHAGCLGRPLHRRARVAAGGQPRDQGGVVLMDVAGLLPSAMGRRVRLSGGSRSVIEGPFPESKQLVAGYWILQVPSMDEAVEWAERFPFEAWSRIYPGEYGAEVEIEIRQVFELSDFGAGEAIEHHARLDKQIAELNSRSLAPPE